MSTPTNNIPSLTLTEPPSTPLSHLTCKTLDVARFKECYCNGDLTVLGEAPQEVLQEVWNNILFEYAALIKTENSEYLLEIGRKIALLQADLTYIESAVVYLKQQHDAEIALHLANIGYPLPENYTHTDLDGVISRAKRLLFDLEELSDEYNKLTNAQQGGKQTEDEFDELLAVLSKHQGYRIIPQTTMVNEFCSIFNIYLKQSKIPTDGRR